MVNSVVVSGRFVNKDTNQPIDGVVEFEPSRLWVDECGISYATLSPQVQTENGRFRVRVTTTDPREGDYGWHYTIKCPMGSWTLKVEGEDGDELSLKDLLPSRFSK